MPLIYKSQAEQNKKSSKMKKKVKCTIRWRGTKV